MIAGEFAEPAHVLISIDAFESCVRLGDAGLDISESQSDFLAAVVEGQDFSGRDSRKRRGHRQSFAVLLHNASIARTNGRSRVRSLFQQ